MKMYMAVTVGEDGNLKVVAEGDERSEVRAELRKVAIDGAVYNEIKVIGKPISLKTRTVTALSVVSEESAEDTAEDTAEGGFGDQ